MDRFRLAHFQPLQNLYSPASFFYDLFIGFVPLQFNIMADKKNKLECQNAAWTYDSGFFASVSYLYAY